MVMKRAGPRLEHASEQGLGELANLRIEPLDVLEDGVAVVKCGLLDAVVLWRQKPLRVAVTAVGVDELAGAESKPRASGPRASGI